MRAFLETKGKNCNTRQSRGRLCGSERGVARSMPFRVTGRLTIFPGDAERSGRGFFAGLRMTRIPLEEETLPVKGRAREAGMMVGFLRQQGSTNFRDEMAEDGTAGWACPVGWGRSCVGARGCPSEGFLGSASLRSG